VTSLKTGHRFLFPPLRDKTAIRVASDAPIDIVNPLQFLVIYQNFALPLSFDMEVSPSVAFSQLSPTPCCP